MVQCQKKEGANPGQLYWAFGPQQQGPAQSLPVLYMYICIIHVLSTLYMYIIYIIHVYIYTCTCIHVQMYILFKGKNMLCNISLMHVCMYIHVFIIFIYSIYMYMYMSTYAHEACIEFCEPKRRDFTA